MLTLKRLLLGAQLGFVLDGTNITNAAGGTVSGPGVKPDGTTPADWAPFGTVEKIDIKIAETKEDIMAPSSGAYRRIDQMRISEMTDLTLVTQELNEVIVASLMRAGLITDDASFSPGITLGEFRGWWNLTQYSQRDNPALNWQFYAIAVVRILELENKTIKPQVDLALLYNALESGKSTLAEA